MNFLNILIMQLLNVKFLQLISCITIMHRDTIQLLNTLKFLFTGSAAIYNTTLSEITNMEEIRKKIGFCPQFNIQFEFLTVRENLRLFAKIKGIQPKEVEQEVGEDIRTDSFGSNLLNLLLTIFLFNYHFTLL